MATFLTRHERVSSTARMVVDRVSNAKLASFKRVLCKGLG